MKNLLLLTTTAVAMMAGQVSAQGLSGSVNLSYGILEGNSDDVSDIFAELLLTGEISLDYEIQNGWYFGGEAIYQSGDEIESVGNGDFYLSGISGSIRVGNTFGWGAAEAFLGLLEADGNEGPAQRYYAGIRVGRQISDQFSLNAQIGYLDGEDTSSEEAGDMLRNATFAGIGGEYRFNDSLSLNLGINGVTGVINQDEDDFDLFEVTLGVDYQLQNNPAWTLFADASYGNYFQFDENDREIVTQLSVGASYSFGSQSPRDVLGNSLSFAEWSAITAGVLE